MSKLLGLAVVLAVASAAPAFAQQTLSNNLSDSYSDMGLSDIFTHDNACGCGPLESAAVVDSFTLSSTSHLTQVQAALTGILENAVSNFTGFQNAAGYQVNIYSSAAAATADIAGDLYSHTFAPGDVSFGAGFEETGYTDYLVGTSLAAFSIDKTLSAGTYWLSVVGIDDPDANESIGVALYGGGNAIQTNPGGGGGIDGNMYPFGETAGYAVSGVAGVPEPASWAMLVAGFGLTGGAMRARRKTAISLRVA
jgi:hypothetical protein